jgi:hypothetical protein
MTEQSKLDYFYKRYIILGLRPVVRVEDDGSATGRAIVGDFFTFQDGTSAKISDLLKELDGNKGRYYVLKP